jgi:hypothetical protein
VNVVVAVHSLRPTGIGTNYRFLSLQILKFVLFPVGQREYGQCLRTLHKDQTTSEGDLYRVTAILGGLKYWVFGVRNCRVTGIAVTCYETPREVSRNFLLLSPVAKSTHTATTELIKSSQ